MKTRIEPPIARSVPSHDLELLADCTLDDLALVQAALAEAISRGAPAFNGGDHEACFRIYEQTALALDGSLEGGTLVKKALLDGVNAASTHNGFTRKAWAMRDAFDGVLDVIARKVVQIRGKKGRAPVREVKRHDVAILGPAGSRSVVAQVESTITDAIELGAPLYNDGHAEACFRIYEGAVLGMLRTTLPDGVKRALEDGLQRCAAAKDSEAKAWVMRDTFDGLLDVIERASGAALN